MKSFNQYNSDLLEYLQGLNSDVILFFDEFEKMYDKEDSFILSLMDGVVNNISRKVFILTTNTLYVNRSLLERPSRIRYKIEFETIDINLVKQYIKDNLKDLSYYDKVICFIKQLSIGTIDIIKQIVEEINIFGYDKFIQNKNIFNAEYNTYKYDVYKYPVYLEKMPIDITLEEYVKNSIIELFKEREGSSESRNGYKDRVYSSHPFDEITYESVIDDSPVIYFDKQAQIIVCDNSYNYLIYYIENTERNNSIYDSKKLLLTL